MADLDNPFMEDSGELIALDTSAIMSDNVVNAIMTVLQVGATQYDRFATGAAAWTSALKSNIIPLFSHKPDVAAL